MSNNDYIAFVGFLLFVFGLVYGAAWIGEHQSLWIMKMIGVIN